MHTRGAARNQCGGEITREKESTEGVREQIREKKRESTKDVRERALRM